MARLLRAAVVGTAVRVLVMIPANFVILFLQFGMPPDRVAGMPLPVLIPFSAVKSGANALLARFVVTPALRHMAPELVPDLPRRWEVYRMGTATLPLHQGTTPRWLFHRMVRLARGVVCALVEDAGPEGVLRRLSDPFWFQAFGCLLGFDWHSSGLTTTVCAALKEGLRGLEQELGIAVAGGKGRASRQTPLELEALGEQWGVDVRGLVYASRISAKVDSNAVQDGYQLYHHCLFATRTGAWAVIQQGMREADRTARRYHWLGEAVSDFVCEPHAAVCADRAVPTLNLVARESEAARKAITAISRESPGRTRRELERALTMPARHQVQASDLDPVRVERVLLRTYEAQVEDFEGLLGLPGVGAKTLRALTLLSELLAGAPPSWRDPARFSFAHGGKDGHPFPVDRETYDRTVAVLEDAVRRVRLGRTERLEALRRLHSWLGRKASWALPGAGEGTRSSANRGI